MGRLGGAGAQPALWLRGSRKRSGAPLSSGRSFNNSLVGKRNSRGFLEIPSNGQGLLQGLRILQRSAFVHLGAAGGPRGGGASRGMTHTVSKWHFLLFESYIHSELKDLEVRLSSKNQRNEQMKTNLEFHWAG